MNINDLSQMNNLKNLAVLCKISYKLTESQNYMPKLHEVDEINMLASISNKFEIIKSIMMNTRAITTTSHDGKILYIAIAGSDDISDFISDLDMNHVRPNIEHIEEIRFHEGFYKQFKGLLIDFKKRIDAFVLQGGNTVYITGHSSGGCIASILAYYLKKINKIDGINNIDLKVVTFGSPFFTNKYGSLWFSNNIDYTRIELDKDPIPNIPAFAKNIKINREYLPLYFHIERNHILISRHTIILNSQKTTKLTLYNFLNLLFKKRLNLKHHKIDSYISKLKITKL